MPSSSRSPGHRHPRARPALELDGLSRHFGPAARRVVALDAVSLQLAPGRIVGLVGRNGAGKTTLLRIATGLIRPTAGCVRVFGCDLERQPGIVTRAIGYLGADERSFPPRLTPLASLCMYGGLRGLGRRDSKRRARAKAEEIGAGDLLERPFQSLSSGQRQRIGLLRAVLHDPRLLLLDEPTQALDSAGSRFVLELARREAQKGAAVLISSHDLTGIEAAADDLVVLDRGRVLASGERARVLPPLANPGWRVTFESPAQREAASKRCADLQPSPDPAQALIDDEDGRFPRALRQLSRGTGNGLIGLERRTHLSLEELVAAIGARSGAEGAEGAVASGTSGATVPSDAVATSKHAAADGANQVDGGSRRPSWLRAALAIARRDLEIQLSYRFKLFVQLGLLCVWAAMFHYLSLLIASDDPDVQAALHGNPFGFLLLGLAALETSQLCTTHMARTLREEQLMGTLEPLVSTGRSPLLVVLASLVWPLTTSIVLMAVVLHLAALTLSADFSRTNVLATSATIAVGCSVMAALGVVSAAFVHSFKRGDPVATILNLVSLVAAGAYFPRQLLPAAVQQATAWLPHTTALGALRAAMLAGAGFDDPEFREPFLLLLASGLVLAPIAAGAWRIAHHYARARGSLAEA